MEYLSASPPSFLKEVNIFMGYPRFREEQATKLEPGGFTTSQRSKFPPWPLRITRNSWQRPWKESRWWEPRLELSQVVSSWGVDSHASNFWDLPSGKHIRKAMEKFTYAIHG